MNAGFSNLDTLKKQLLANSLQADKRFDAALLAIGRGAAAAFERFCQRNFTRVVDGTEIIGADHVEFLLSRFPLESVSKIERKLTEAAGWEELVINDVVKTIDLASGIVRFAGSQDMGPHDAQMRFTFTGGYWWDTAEPDDEGYPTDAPEGAALLPDDIRLAWLLHCEGIWAKRDKLGTSIVDKPAQQSDTGTLELSPLVKQMLGDYVRYNLT